MSLTPEKTLLEGDLETQNSVLSFVWKKRTFKLFHDNRFCRFNGNVLRETHRVDSWTRVLQIPWPDQFAVYFIDQHAPAGGVKCYRLKAKSASDRDQWVLELDKMTKIRGLVGSVAVGFQVGSRKELVFRYDVERISIRQKALRDDDFAPLLKAIDKGLFSLLTDLDLVKRIVKFMM